MKYCERSDNHFNNVDLLQEMYCDSFYKNLRPNKINTSQMLLSLQPQSDFQEQKSRAVTRGPNSCARTTTNGAQCDRRRRIIQLFPIVVKLSSMYS